MNGDEIFSDYFSGSSSQEESTSGAEFNDDYSALMGVPGDKAILDQMQRY